MEIRVEVEGIKRTGVTKSNKPYFIISCYVTLPGLKHPQACELFSDKALNPGLYSCPLVASIRDNRPAFDVELSAAQPLKPGVSAPQAA